MHVATCPQFLGNSAGTLYALIESREVNDHEKENIGIDSGCSDSIRDDGRRGMLHGTFPILVPSSGLALPALNL
jgi:hypothetical protein